MLDEEQFLERIREMCREAREPGKGKSVFLTQDELDREWLLMIVDRLREKRPPTSSAC